MTIPSVQPHPHHHCQVVQVLLSATVSRISSICNDLHQIVINRSTIITDLDFCNEGDVRLANGDIEQEGRLEVCVGGLWGSVCYNGWDTIDAYVVCKQLGRDSRTGRC